MSGMDPARARAFDAWAADYERFRPRYPEALFTTIASQLGLPPHPDVVDLGAGTGQASRPMARLGWRVTAVEPGEPMLHVLRDRAAVEGLALTTIQSSAEDTGLPSASADLVTAAAAFHWFDQQPAVNEIARILKPGGGLAVFFQQRADELSPLLADFTRMLERYVREGDNAGFAMSAPKGTTRRAIEARADAFASPQSTRLRHEVQTTPEEFIGMAFTNSYVRVHKSADQQHAFRVEMMALLARHGLTGGRPFEIPYQIRLWTARRLS